MNFVGTFALTKALIPLIAKNQGRIANVTVPSEISPYWHPLAYVASKAAQNAMMGVMAIEFQQANTPVEIFSVHPGPTTTDLNGNMALPGFHDIETVGQKFAELINDGLNHQAEPPRRVHRTLSYRKRGLKRTSYCFKIARKHTVFWRFYANTMLVVYRMTYRRDCESAEIAVPLQSKTSFNCELRRRLSNSNKFDCIRLALILHRK